MADRNIHQELRDALSKLESSPRKMDTFESEQHKRNLEKKQNG